MEEHWSSTESQPMAEDITDFPGGHLPAITSNIDGAFTDDVHTTVLLLHGAGVSVDKISLCIKVVCLQVCHVLIDPLPSDVEIQAMILQEAIQKETDTNGWQISVEQDPNQDPDRAYFVIDTTSNITETTAESEDIANAATIVKADADSNGGSELFEESLNSYSASQSMINEHFTENAEEKNKDGPHTCTICQRTFTARTNLRRHMKVHTPESQHHRCEVCGKTFSRADMLKNHMASHGTDTPYSCSDCRKSYKTQAQLRKHENKCTGFTSGNTEEEASMAGLTVGKDARSCPLCDATFSVRSNLRRHLKSAHDEGRQNSIQCLYCPTTFTRSDILRNHEALHENTNLYKCNDCDKSYITAQRLATHSVIHDEQRPFECGECGDTFKKSFCLKQHMAVHLARTEKCGVCGAGYATEPQLRRHQLKHLKSDPKPIDEATYMRTHPESDGQCSCLICDGNFTSPEEYSVHFKTHLDAVSAESPNKKPQCTCPTCGRVFSDPGRLQRHEMIHTGERKHECEVCGKRFSRTDALQQHMLRHTGIKAHLCTKCGKAFTTKGHLDRHQVIHMTSRPHTCSVCQASFKTRPTLNAHLIVHRAQVKPFACAVCGKTFRTSAMLRVHGYHHLAVKPFKCEKCEMTFAQKSLLQRHMEKVHAIVVNIITISEDYASPVPDIDSAPVLDISSPDISMQTTADVLSMPTAEILSSSTRDVLLTSDNLSSPIVEESSMKIEET